MLELIFSMKKIFLSRESKFIISAAFMISFFSFLSKILGIFRNRIFAEKFGASDKMDIYFAAFRVPDLIYNILIIGAFSIMFLPVYFQYFSKNKAEADKFFISILNLFSILVVFISLAFIFFVPYLMPLIVYGFSGNDLNLTIKMTQIMLLSPILLGISNILNNYLQAKKKFFTFAFAPVLYNLGIIFGALFLTQKYGIFGLAYGVLLGAFLHFLVQVYPVIKTGIFKKYQPKFFHPGIKKMFWLSLPRLFSLLVYQLNLIVIVAIASTLTEGSISIFNFANDLQYIPIGIFSLAFVSAVFPYLSESFSKGDVKGFLNKFYTTVNQILFLVIPVSVFLILERAQIIRVILGTGEFSWEDTRLTAAALGLFSLSIFAQSLIPLFLRAFFAMGNSKLPVLINSFSLVLNMFLSFYFVNLLKVNGNFRYVLGEILKVSDIPDISVLGLPLAFSVASIINLLILYFAISHKIKEYDSTKILFSVNRINISSFFAGVAVYFILHTTANFVDMHTFLGIFIQGFLAFLGGALVYLFFTYMFKVPEFFMFWQAFTLPIRRLFFAKRYFSEINGSDKM